VFTITAAHRGRRTKLARRTLPLSEIAARVERHGGAECTLVLGRPLAFDLAQTAAATERFVSVDNRTSDQS